MERYSFYDSILKITKKVEILVFEQMIQKDTYSSLIKSKDIDFT